MLYSNLSRMIHTMLKMKYRVYKELRAQDRKYDGGSSETAWNHTHQQVSTLAH